MTEPIHVAMIIQSFLPRLGGAERQLAALLPLLKKREINCSILTRQYDSMPPFEWVHETPVYRFPAPGGKVRASLTYTLAAIAKLRRLNPDIVHAHELLSPSTIALASRVFMKTPVVAKVLRGGVLGDVYKLKNRKLGYLRLRLFARYFNRFITISSEIAGDLTRSGVSLERQVFIPNGVDITRFKPLSIQDKTAMKDSLELPGTPIVIFSGRLAPEKRVSFLINNWPHVRESVPGANLVILGSGPEEDNLKAKQVPGVLFRGYQSDVLPYLQSADSFVLPSATEGLSNALLEGMASGLAPVATRVGGTEDLIRDKENGLLVPVDDSKALQSALIQVLNNRDLRVRMGSQARERVVKDYSLENTATQLSHLYRSISGKEMSS